MTTRFPIRLQPSGLNDSFDDSGYSFSEYIKHSREKITRGRVDLTPDNSELIINANSPSEWIPENPEAINPKTGRIHNGILLIHGLLDSASSLKSIADHFKKLNFLVRVLLLPGHGTRPGDLLNIHYSEWLKATQFGIDSFSDEVDNLYLAGFSTGGSIAIHHALHDPRINGLYLFSPAIKIALYKTILNASIKIVRDLLTRIFPRFHWLIIKPDNDYAKYESLTFNAGVQLYYLSKNIRTLWQRKKLTIPVFIGVSLDDEVVNQYTTLKFFLTTTNPCNRLIVYTTHSLTFDDPRIIVINSAIPKQRIVNFSHICVAVAPNHPHYGQYGDYHPFYNPIKVYGCWFKNNATQEIHYGAINFKNVRHYSMARLSYNPYFSEMTKSMDEFLKSIDPKKSN